MRLRNRDLGDRPNTRLEKKRKLEDDAEIKDSFSPESGRGKESRLAPKKIKKKRAVQQRRESSPLEEKILELLSDASPPESNSLLEVGNENVRPMPPAFQKRLHRLRKSGDFSEAMVQYYLNLSRGDSRRVPVEVGGKSLLEDVLAEDADKARNTEGGSTESRWKRGKRLGQGDYGVLTLWEKPRRKKPIVTKDANEVDMFFLDYNSEGNLARRLNDVGCKNVIKVVDWFLIGEHFRTCFEFAEFGELRTLVKWYRDKGIVFPEAFVWHIFHSIANALCFCRHGTNRLHSRTHRKGWDRIIHNDIDLGNILLAAPDADDHRLYPCPKLADFGQSYTLGGPLSEMQTWRKESKMGPAMYIALEVDKKVPSDRLPRPGECQDSYSDVYSLGVVIAVMCLQANTKVTDTIQHLLEKGTSANPSGLRNFSAYYSPQLKELIRRCRSLNPLERPPIYSLYLETKSGMEAFRDRAYQELQESPDPLIAGVAVYHNKVLYTEAERQLYDDNWEFHLAYKRANLNPVFDAEAETLLGSQGVERKYERLLTTIDDSIVTAIPEMAKRRPSESSSDSD